MYKRILLSAALMTSLTACGSTPFDRGTSGAGLGAATGAVLGAIKIESRGAQNHRADRETVEARYRQSFRESPWG